MKLKYRVDASALKKSACALAFKRLVIDGYTGFLPHNDTQYGSALHKFMATCHESSGNVGLALDAALKVFDRPCVIRKKHLTKDHFIKTCLAYWKHLSETDDFEVLVVDGKPLVEVQFEVPIFMSESVDIDLVGTIDKVGKFRGGCYAIGDYKTTSSWSTKEYFEDYRLSTQLLVYYWSLKQMAVLYPDSPLAKIAAKQMGVFIDGIFLSSSKETQYLRSEVFLPKQKVLDEFAVLMQRKIKRIVEIVTTNEQPIREGIIQGTCVDGKFRCDFFNVCGAPDDVAGEMLLKKNFRQKEYNPFKFGEE